MEMIILRAIKTQPIINDNDYKLNRIRHADGQSVPVFIRYVSCSREISAC